MTRDNFLISKSSYWSENAGKVQRCFTVVYSGGIEFFATMKAANKFINQKISEDKND